MSQGRILTRTATLGVAFAVLCLSPFSPAALAQDQAPVPERVNNIFTRMDSSRLDQIWPLARDLENMGAKATADIAKGLKRNGVSRLATAKALLTMEGGDVYRNAALKALKEIIFSKQERDVRVLAATLILNHGGKSDLRSLRKRSKEIDDPYVKIEVMKGLRSFGRRELKKFLDSDDEAVKAQAALALAAIGNADAAKAVLDRMKAEPTQRGQQARLYLERERMLERLAVYGGLKKKEDILKLQQGKIKRLEKELERARFEARKGTKGNGKARSSRHQKTLDLLDEILNNVQSFYVDEKKIKEKDLGNAAARGLMESLDPFSSYMTEAQTKRFNESIRQSYAGIGAVVRSDPHSHFLTIVSPVYGGPAYKAGLRTMDQIVEVQGVSTKNKSVRELVGVLKGKSGTEVRIKYVAFLDPKKTVKDLVIVREFVSMPSVSYDLLPGNVGYLQLSQFGYKATPEVAAALEDLMRKGMNGLIFDLRGNPGGLLPAAVEISEMFLKKDDLIVYQEGRKNTEVGKKKEFRARRDSPLPNFPLVIMINEDSASASEIVSGALKVHKRATLVGQRSFGKGSVQQLYKVRTTRGQSMMRLTIAYYYLPDGTCIHRNRSARVWHFREALFNEIIRWRQDGLINPKQAEHLRTMYQPTPGGVEPHVYARRESLSRETQIKLVRLQNTNLIIDYIEKHYAKNRKLFHKLAKYDGESGKQYPGFDELMKEIKIDLEEDQVRDYLRFEIRKFVQDDIGKTLPSDFLGDGQMERSIFEVLKKAGLDPKTVPEYAKLSARVEKAIVEDAARKKEAAAKPPAKKAGEKNETAPKRPTPGSKKKDKKSKDF